MIIGFDARCLMQKNYSGVPQYAVNLLRALLASDSKNEYRLFYNSSKKINPPVFDSGRVQAMKTGFPNKSLNFSLMFFNRPKIDKIIGGADLLFMPNMNFFALSRNCPLVLTVHDLSFLRFGDFFTSKTRLWHRLAFYKNLRRADIILADSDNTTRDLIDVCGVRPEKIRTVYGGVSADFRPLPSDNPNLERVRAKYNLKPNFLFFVGALEPRKNLVGAIEAFKKLDWNGEFIIAGGGGWKNANLTTLAADDPRIKFIGYVDEADKPTFYNLSTALVYPSYYEGFGLPLVEAMACAKPVIFGRNSSQTEVAGEAGISVNPLDIAEIRQAMEAIVFSPSLARALGEEGLKRARMFSWEEAAKKTLKVFNELKNKN